MALSASLKKSLRLFFDIFADVLNPENCLSCDKFVWTFSENSFLCPPCSRKNVFSPCIATLSASPLYSLGLYSGLLEKAIHQLKFYHLKRVSFYLAQQLFANWHSRRVFDSIDCVSAVPISRARHFERGFNQSEEIAKNLSKMIQKPYRSFLRKVKNCPPQMTLGRQERLVNVKGAFKIVRPVNYSKILLIDDVVTTGSTLNECCSQLRTHNKTLPIVAMVLAKA